jgi:hypothetical protein
MPDQGVGVADFVPGTQVHSINLLCSYKSTNADSKDCQAEQRWDPHSDKSYEKKNARLEGMDFLLDECGKLRPKGAFSDPLLCNGLQLAGVLNIQLAMEADALGAVLTYADVC